MHHNYQEKLINWMQSYMLVLWHGYNSKNISSITVSSNVATVTTSTAHGYNQYDIVKISGANESIFNDDFEIASVPTTTTFTFNLTTALTSASGTITCKIAPLGWSQSFTSGSGKSVYHSNDVTGTGLYLRVDDTGTKSTQVNMYETMTTVDVGTGKSQDTWWAKSSIANTATHQWYLVGNSKCFYLMTEVNLGYPYGLSNYFFGDTVSFRANDPWCCALGGQSAADQSYGNQSTGMLRRRRNNSRNVFSKVGELDRWLCFFWFLFNTQIFNIWVWDISECPISISDWQCLSFISCLYMGIKSILLAWKDARIILSRWIH